MRKTMTNTANEMQSFTHHGLCERISRSLKKTLYSRARYARRLKTDPRTFKAYWDGEAAPPALKLVMMMAENVHLHEEINNIVQELRQNGDFTS